ncbi:MAG: TolC family protein [Lentisphaeria bacterium]
MNCLLYRASGFLAALLLTGCISSNPATDAFRTRKSSPPSPASRSSKLTAIPPEEQSQTVREPGPISHSGDTADELPLSDTPSTIAAETAGPLTLRRALSLTLRHNPELKAFSKSIRAAEARLVEAGLRSNPELALEVDEVGGTGELAGTDAAEFSVSLAQTFPLGGDIRRRRNLAEYQTLLTKREYETVRTQVLTNVTRRFVQALAAQRNLTVAEQELELAGEIQAAVEKRVEAGASPEIEQIRARVPVAKAEVKVRQWQRRLAAAHRQLALSWDSRKPEFTTVTGNLDDLTEPPSPEALASLISRNPEVAQWAVKVSVHRAEEDLARAEAVPDITAGIGMKRFNENDETAFVIGISLPLPLFDRNQGEIRAAKADAQASEFRKKEAERRLETQLSIAWTQLSNAYEEAVMLRKRALPAAKEAFEVTRRAFENGDVEFIDVLDAERTLVDLQNRHVAALDDYHTGAADIEGLIGRPISELPETKWQNEPQEQE